MIKLEKDKKVITTYLQAQKWLLEGEYVEKIEVPGEGNMNFTLRVITKRQSFIIKQSREYVEKYPQVAAPAERVQREAEFYEEIKDDEFLESMTPKIIGLDGFNNIMAMEDLGAGTDFTYLYEAKDIIKDDDLREIMRFAAHLHTHHKVENAKKVISNRNMRKLNHEHIFIYPYLEENGINLDDIIEGLGEIGKAYKNDPILLEKVKSLGDLYLSDGESLLHGDYFPGSWLRTEDGINIIDPEFCFYGFPEFEIGVTTAHLMMADQPVETVFNAYKYYTEFAPLNLELCKQFAGIEIMRRILGLAQLPLKIDLEKRGQLLETAREYILNEK